MPRSTLLCLVLTASCAAGEDDPGGQGGEGGEPELPFELPGSAHDHGDPTAEEQELLELVQRLRADPAGMVEFLVSVPEAQGSIQHHGITREELDADFATYPAAPPLAFDPRLIAAARGHAQDLATGGAMGHDGSDGSDVGDRVARQGYAFTIVAENVFEFSASSAHAISAFAIDWGVPSLGHRYNLLDLDRDGVTPRRRRHAGFGIVRRNERVSAVTQNMATEGGNGSVYLVGVAYRDLDGDGAYDPGEGVAGRAIVPSSGDLHALTSESGGYAIPFPPDAGAIRVQLQQDGAVADAADVTIAGENVKLDFVLP